MKYKLKKLDLWGNDNDGYDCNDTIDCGAYELPNLMSEPYAQLTDKELLEYFVKEGVFDQQALKSDEIRIEGDMNYLEIEFTWLKNSPVSVERFTLELQD